MERAYGYLKTFDGTKLFVMKEEVKNPKAVILIVHGLAEHCERYDYVISKLVEFGYSVYAFDNRGHGRSEGKRGHVDFFMDFVKDTDYMVELIGNEHRKKGLKTNPPIFMLGHSMGGFITAAYGIVHGERINGQILSAAATGTIPLAMKMKNIRLPYILRSEVPNVFADVVCTNKQVVEEYKADKLVLKVTSLRLNTQIANEGISWLNENIKKYNSPCLILHGKDDKIVSPQSSQDFYDKISSEKKEIKMYEGLYHEILNEDFKDEILSDINKWIEGQIGLVGKNA